MISTAPLQLGTVLATAGSGVSISTLLLLGVAGAIVVALIWLYTKQRGGGSS